MYVIKEIFGPTIQGEGSFAGCPVMFIRFAGCNKWNGQEKGKENSICFFCDTDFNNGTKMSSNEILDDLNGKSNGLRVVVLSGGEPTLQMDEEILSKLRNRGYKIHVETNGSKDISHLEEYIEHVTMSPKQSIEDTKLKNCHDLKILIPWISKDITMDNFKAFPCLKKYVQPEWSKGNDKAIQYVIKNHDVKISLQLHKIMGVE